ncbi:MAG: discoidin domain-containing protein, partial [Bacteroidales bacterium]|nr:discoidin domain-containing protein [Bacteroidales bacterium]
YPGNPDENSAPVMVQDDSYRNIALHRASYASSSYDYNLTAQLVTDGIIASDMPKFMKVSTSGGSVPRREREWLVDQGHYTRPTFEGSSTAITFELGNGWKERVDNVQMLGYVNFLEEEADGTYEISFHASDNGNDWEKIGEYSGKGFPGEKLSPRKHSDPDKSAALGDRLLPRRLIDLNVKLSSDKEYAFFKVSLNMPGAQEWVFTNCDFYNEGSFVDLVSSQFFCSTWMSLGTEQEWVYVDLGTVAKFDRIVMHWLNRPAGCMIQVSNNALKWKKLAELHEDDTVNVRGKGRYVRILMNGSADGKPMMLSEIEVWGKGGLKPISESSWKIKRAAESDAQGTVISMKDFDDSEWIAATVPGTVLTSYVNIGAVPDPNHADNLLHISDSYFNSDFWYRKEFDIRKTDGKRMFLEFDGINWKAEVYFNGKFLGCIEGGFKRGRFDITDLAEKGTNTLAVRIIKNAHIGAVKEKNEENTGINGGILGADNPTFHASIGWDWISTIRGRNIGIWNDVRIVAEGPVSLKDPFVNAALPLPDTTSAVITPEVYVRNNDGKPVCGVLKGFVGDVQFEQEVALEAGEERLVRFDMISYPQLMIENPRLWWPNGYGEQHL